MADWDSLVGALRAEGLQPDAGPRRLAEYSYDASNYRVTPAAVVFPRSEDDVAAAARVCHRLGIPLTVRGGGTSMSGNSIGGGLIVDMSRHLHCVLAVDEAARTATAEAGVVLTQLREAVFEATDRRLTFAPDPSSQSRACLGGAIGNDACGNHSVRYGRTADHVVELRGVTADGLRITATRAGIRASVPGDAAAAARADHLEAELRSLAADHLAAIRTELGRIPRQVSGYHLRHLLPEAGFDVARALVGSEGTCLIVTAATVALAEQPTSTSLIVAGYADIVDAARDVPLLLQHRPTAVEGIDEVIVATMRMRRGDDAVADLPEGRAWLFIELDEDAASTARAAALVADLRADGRAVDLRQVDDPTARADLWRVREDGAGLSSRLTDPETGETVLSWPGWEDAAVRPDLLGDYLAEFRDLLNRHHLTGVMYGHFGAGCMHIRIDFDLRTARGRTVFRDFCTDAAHLVVRYDGSLSGEHGDGRARSELLPIMYSAEMLRAFERFGALWDPAGILAPGGLRQTRPIDVDLALADVTAEHGSQACIGVGRCRTHVGGVMCPSFRATGDEKDSTRGRSRVLQEATRDGDVDWQAPALAEAMELCLACKACSSDCPTGVDMAAMKSEVLHHRYRRRLRPRAHYSLGMLPTWLRLTPYAAGPLNRLLATRVGRAGARLGGIGADRVLPEFASAAELRAELRRAPAGFDSGAPPEIVLFLDSFTRGLRPEVAGAAARVLGGAHRSVACSADHCCGLTQITTGRLDAARRTLRRTARYLDSIGDVPIVVVEPSCAATLRDDLPRLLSDEAVGPDDAARARRVGARVRSAAAHLGELAADGRAPEWPGGAPEYVVVQTHCHEYATFGNRVQRSVLTALGVGSVVEATGCCGVAGDFGFTAGHEEVADAVAQQALAPALRSHPDAPVLTDGFSCATQIRRLAVVDPSVRGTVGDDRRGRHLLELLDPDPIRRRPGPSRSEQPGSEPSPTETQPGGAS